jgi:hypothetical protein
MKKKLLALMIAVASIVMPSLASAVAIEIPLDDNGFHINLL